MRKSLFLPLFFTALAVAFAVAAWIRLSSVQVEAVVETSGGPPGSEPKAARPVESVSPERSSMETATIVDSASGEETPVNATSARQQRYNELLRSSAPAAVPAEPLPQKEPTFVDRVASVLGIERRKPPQQVVAAPPPQPRSEQRAPEQAPPAEDSGPKAAEKKPVEEADPETDVTPPQLLNAMFTPPQVQDDQETVLAVTVQDNLSGVRGVSGVIASPSGALQGFACQREGATDRFVSRIKVPRDAAEGTWMVKYLTLTDSANNSVNLNQAAGSLPPSASFRVVSNAPDSTAPVLKSVYLEKRAMTAGERNIVFVQAEDDKSGVTLVSGVFVSPSKQARIGFGCRPGTGGAWECTLSPPACLDCGAWQLEQIQLQDKANNMATFRGDNQMVSQVALDISGDKCDAGPPAIRSLTLDPPVVSNAEGGTIQVAAIVSDDACGVASLSGQAVPSGAQGGQRIYFSFDPSPDGQNFLGRITVPRHAAKGTWMIGWIQALDKGNNLRAYSSNDPVLSRVSFTVE